MQILNQFLRYYFSFILLFTQLILKKAFEKNLSKLKNCTIKVSHFNSSANIKNNPKKSILEFNDDASISSLDSEEKFSTFINDRKQYLKAKNHRHKLLNSSKKNTEIEVSELLGEANNYYMKNQYDEVNFLKYSL